MWEVYGRQLKSRLLIGTARYPSPQLMLEAIKAAESDVVTVSIRRHALNNKLNNNAIESTIPGRSAPLDNGHPNRFLEIIKNIDAHILPNTAGARTAAEAVNIAKMAREIFKTSWIKLEVTGDDYTLEPDPIETVKAAFTLINDGFQVFPYSNDSLTLALRLQEAGCKIIMPWASPIGSGQGPRNLAALRTLRERLPDTTLIVDAGLGKPSHAAQVMEMGFDAVLLNTAIAQSADCASMAKAFKLAVEAGRLAYLSGIVPEHEMAAPSSPLLGIPFSAPARVEA